MNRRNKIDRHFNGREEARTAKIKPYIQKLIQAKDMKIKNSGKRLTK